MVETQRFEERLSEKGFVHGGVWHFRGSWFYGPDRIIFDSLIDEGLLERVGTIGELKGEGMEFPDRTEYNGHVSLAVIYHVIDQELNERVLEMNQNGQN